MFTCSFPFTHRLWLGSYFRPHCYLVTLRCPSSPCFINRASSWFPTFLSLIRLHQRGLGEDSSNRTIKDCKVTKVSKPEANGSWRKLNIYHKLRLHLHSLLWSGIYSILLIRAWGAWLPPFIYTISSAWQLGSLIYASYSLSNTVSEFMV